MCRIAFDTDTKNPRPAVWKGANVKRIYSTEAYHNLDVYQLNAPIIRLWAGMIRLTLSPVRSDVCSRYSQIYYVGLLPEKRHRIGGITKMAAISTATLTALRNCREVERPVVQNILYLARFRNSFRPLMENANHSHGSELTIKRSLAGYSAELVADMQSYECSVSYGAGWSEAVFGPFSKICFESCGNERKRSSWGTTALNGIRKFEKTCDQLIEGSWDYQVRGVATTFMPRLM